LHSAACFNPPGGSSWAGAQVKARRCVVASMFQSAGRIVVGWSLVVAAFAVGWFAVSIRRADRRGLEPAHNSPVSRLNRLFQSAGRIVVGWSRCCSTARWSAGRGFNPPGGSSWAGAALLARASGRAPRGLIRAARLTRFFLTPSHHPSRSVPPSMSHWDAKAHFASSAQDFASCFASRSSCIGRCARNARS
jgi:hypothetical protein